MPNKNASADPGEDIDIPDPRARWRFNAKTGKFDVEDGRYRFDKVRRLFMGETESYDVPIAELRLYQKKMHDLWDYKKARVQAIQDRARAGGATDDDRRELTRLDELEAKIRRGISHVQYVEKQTRKYSPTKGTPAEPVVPRSNERLDETNLRAIEAIQAIRVDRRRGSTGREWGFAVDNFRVGAQRHQDRVQSRQGFMAVPMDPGFSYQPSSIPLKGTPGEPAAVGMNADLLGHTHPSRLGSGLRTVSYPTIYPPARYTPKQDPEIREILKAGGREVTKEQADRAQEQVATFEAKHAQALRKIKAAEDLARSIAWDDCPSGADLINATSSKVPRMIVMPRRNLLLIPGPRTKALGTGDKKMDDATEDRLRDVVHDADRFAWNRAHASFPKSAQDAERKVGKYQRLREQSISAAIERTLQMRARFYDKGDEIAFPGEVASTPRRAGKKTRSEKKKERREQKEIEERQKKIAPEAAWDPW